MDFKGKDVAIALRADGKADVIIGAPDLSYTYVGATKQQLIEALGGFAKKQEEEWWEDMVVKVYTLLVFEDGSHSVQRTEAGLTTRRLPPADDAEWLAAEMDELLG